jgi:hypothetical protein
VDAARNVGDAKDAGVEEHIQMIEGAEAAAGNEVGRTGKGEMEKEVIAERRPHPLPENADIKSGKRKKRKKGGWIQKVVVRESVDAGIPHTPTASSGNGGVQSVIAGTPRSPTASSEKGGVLSVNTGTPHTPTASSEESEVQSVNAGTKHMPSASLKECGVQSVNAGAPHRPTASWTDLPEVVDKVGVRRSEWWRSAVQCQRKGKNLNFNATHFHTLELHHFVNEDLGGDGDCLFRHLLQALRLRGREGEMGGVRDSDDLRRVCVNEEKQHPLRYEILLGGRIENDERNAAERIELRHVRFLQHVKDMAKHGTYGTYLEVEAFRAVYDLNVYTIACFVNGMMLDGGEIQHVGENTVFLNLLNYHYTLLHHRGNQVQSDLQQLFELSQAQNIALQEDDPPSLVPSNTLVLENANESGVPVCVWCMC